MPRLMRGSECQIRGIVGIVRRSFSRLRRDQDDSERDPESRSVDADVVLPEFETIAHDNARLLDQSLSLELSTRPGFRGKTMQRYDEGVVLCEPPMEYAPEELGELAALPFVRDQHPVYDSPIPALETVSWSVISHRGCPGGCSFCGIAIHQGRSVVARNFDF